MGKQRTGASLDPDRREVQGYGSVSTVLGARLTKDKMRTRERRRETRRSLRSPRDGHMVRGSTGKSTTNPGGGRSKDTSGKGSETRARSGRIQVASGGRCGAQGPNEKIGRQYYMRFDGGGYRKDAGKKTMGCVDSGPPSSITCAKRTRGVRRRGLLMGRSQDSSDNGVAGCSSGGLGQHQSSNH